MPLPRDEYPRPQFRRTRWQCLNGPWSFTFDFGQSGQEQGYPGSQGFDRTITVPFCPESPLSGVEHSDFIPALWYHRTLQVPQAWQGERILLHFGGVDYHCVIYLDGQPLGEHWGGSSAFSVDLTSRVRFGETQHLVVWVEDTPRSRVQPCGKQSRRHESYGCYYTRVTGIWQTVWLEPVPSTALESVQVLPDLDQARFHFVPRFNGLSQSGRCEYRLHAQGREVAHATGSLQSGVPVSLTLSTPQPWSPESPFLYDWEVRVFNDSGVCVDQVEGYAGLRKVHWEDGRLLLNNRPLYLRLVLDQGFYPEGIWTAPTDEALRRDIELGQAAGFHGARLHQKVFEPRYHYWADRLGYLTWAESPSWGLDEQSPLAARNFLGEWREIVEQVRNHPSVIAWTPLNETQFAGQDAQQQRLTREAYDLTRSLDPTRPINDSSGWVHVKTDLWTVHCYQQDPEELRALLSQMPYFRNHPDLEPEYSGQPYLVDEFGGIFWDPGEGPGNGWGYGTAPRSLEAFHQRLQALLEVLWEHSHLAGYCYTQLTDVEQECNGLYSYDRRPKFDLSRIAPLFQHVPD
jgi:beta-galactosidase/beta-glucuronidase